MDRLTILIAIKNFSDNIIEVNESFVIGVCLFTIINLV
jgi:hypothetical protein